MDEQSFLKMLHEHQGIIHKVCRLYKESAEDREDLFQEITYQLWKACPGYRSESKVSTWMYRVALNTALASFRKTRPDIRYETDLPDLPAAERSEEQLYRQERLFILLKQLSEGERAIVALYLDEMSHKEIAEVIGTTENNIAVKLNRIKNKLQKLQHHGTGTTKI
ncbi:RNA polymerase sigma factor [Pedobacter faecalis]|uniref:RNA polymerase sigma factor n=1 Tax=Pedobacter faecalis TaxID=3041495 RepID=UPI0025504D42|nr:sigma-70 family RNA polymerase sigma factor [Pedobacter sp. ELA7]